MIVELEVGLRNLSVVFMCRLTFYVLVYSVHIGGKKAGAYLFIIIYN